MNTQSLYLRIASVLGGLAVALGAFGAHGLKQRLPEEMLQIFEVGVRYQFYHALAMLAIAVVATRLWESRLTSAACAAWTLGVILFSGSLYLLALTGARWIGAITPFGGMAFIVGWAMLFFAAAATLR
ncbi:MAG TPA: DUF423 domain-containing protein [Candidatus Hydrogenedentes bacterium]|nr:DUF423 domain-containing protein [Candidatus Hydrogenedentota bacterium]HNT87751.1 DUF423 domain-containing protein [Candidatus Hydrogenedentota bacterium]